MVDSSEPRVPTGLSPAAALKRIDDLTTHRSAGRSTSAMGEVYDAVAGCDRPLHVVYVLTDLGRTSVDCRAAGRGARQGREDQEGARAARMVTFVLRLTPKEIRNVSVDTAEPSSTIATQGEPVEIRGPDPLARHEADDPDRRVLRRRQEEGREDVEIPPNGEVEVNFTRDAASGEANLHQGKIKLSGTPDPFRWTTSGSSHSRSARRSRSCSSTTTSTRPCTWRLRLTRTPRQPSCVRSRSRR